MFKCKLSLQSFDRLREAHGGSNRVLEEKLYAIKGDITMPKFGVSKEDLEILSKDCTIVFNSAATIRFVEPIDIAVRNNIYSVGQLIEFCNELSNLEALVHLSTAYSNCHKRDTINEIFYEPPMRGDQIMETVERLKYAQGQIHIYSEDETKLQQFYFDGPIATSSKTTTTTQTGPRENGLSVEGGVSPTVEAGEDQDSQLNLDLLGEFTRIALRLSNRPNTYTFTKAISESYLLDKVKARPDRYLNDKIPVAIVRPSIVGGAWREPKVGLVDNFNGPTGAILSLYTGTLQAMPGIAERVADLVPVDMVTNMILCAAWRMVEEQNNSALASSSTNSIKTDNGVYLFNFVSGYRNPLRWGLVTEKIAELSYKYPSKFLTRLPSSYFIQAGKIYDLYDMINQRFPAYLRDLVCGKLLGQRVDGKSSAMYAYTRIRQMTDALTPFTSNQWRLCDTNVRLLFDNLSGIDKKLFHFDVTSISWPDYIQSYIIGSRIYTLKDDPKNVSKALVSLRRRKITNGISLVMLIMMFYYIFISGCCLHF